MDSTEKTLVIAALVVAGAAFIIAFAQALLQYLTSSHREKCLSGAIGEWSRHTKTRWDFKAWRIKVYYGRLNITADGLLDAIAETGLNNSGGPNLLPWIVGELKSTDGIKVFDESSSTNEEYPWKSLRAWWGTEALWKQEDEAPGTERIPFIWELGKGAVFRFAWALVTQRRTLRVGKAGWVNLLGALGVDDAPSMVEHMLPADSIPNSLDVPVQTISAYNLILCCFLLNIKEFQMDILQGDFVAQNDLIKVSTEVIPAAGKVVMVDGNFMALRSLVTLSGTDERAAVLRLTSGNIVFPRFQAWNTFYRPKDILLAIGRAWDSTDWENHAQYRRVTHAPEWDIQSMLRESSVPWQAHHYNQRFVASDGDREPITPTRKSQKKRDGKFNINNDAHRGTHYIDPILSPEMWADFWLDACGAANPCLIMTMAFQPYLNMCAGFPRRLLLPYDDYFSNRRVALLASPNFVPIQKERGLLDHLIDTPNEFTPYIRSESTFITTFGIGSDQGGKWAWTCNPSRDVLIAVIKGAADLVFDPEEKLILPMMVIKLLEGLDMKSARDEIANLYHFYEIEYSLESVVWLALLIVDTRIQMLWCHAEGGTENDDDLLSGFYRALDIVPPGEAEGKTNQEKFEEAGEFIELVTGKLADFLALWLELGERVDVLGDTSTLVTTLAEILSEWEDGEEAEELCVPPVEEQHPLYRDMEELLQDEDCARIRPSVTKREFSAWVKEATVIDVVVAGLAEDKEDPENEEEPQDVNQTGDEPPITVMATPAETTAKNKKKGNKTEDKHIKFRHREYNNTVDSPSSLPNPHPNNRYRRERDREKGIPLKRTSTKPGNSKTTTGAQSEPTPKKTRIRKYTRLQLLVKMVPLLQLRILMLHLWWSCAGDSSLVLEAESHMAVNLRLV